MNEHRYKDLLFKKVKDESEFKNILVQNDIKLDIPKDKHLNVSDVYLVYKNEKFISMIGRYKQYTINTSYKFTMEDYVNIWTWKERDDDLQDFKGQSNPSFFSFCELFIFDNIEYETFFNIILSEKLLVKDYKSLLLIFIVYESMIIDKMNLFENIIREYLKKNNINVDILKRIKVFLSKYKKRNMKKKQEESKNVIICENNCNCTKLSNIDNFVADVVITDSSQYSVALTFNKENIKPIIITTKGINDLSSKISETAQHKMKIPVVEDPVLARAIYDCYCIHSEIPPSLYKAVKEIYNYINPN